MLNSVMTNYKGVWGSHKLVCKTSWIQSIKNIFQPCFKFIFFRKDRGENKPVFMLTKIRQYFSYGKAQRPHIQCSVLFSSISLISLRYQHWTRNSTWIIWTFLNPQSIQTFNFLLILKSEKMGLDYLYNGTKSLPILSMLYR